MQGTGPEYFKIFTYDTRNFIATSHVIPLLTVLLFFRYCTLLMFYKFRSWILNVSVDISLFWNSGYIRQAYDTQIDVRAWTHRNEGIRVHSLFRVEYQRTLPAPRCNNHGWEHESVSCQYSPAWYLTSLLQYYNPSIQLRDC